jgi:protoheme IX farnesyltransferase
MERTRRRPVVDGTITPLEGTVFGVVLMATGTLIIGYSPAGWLAAALALTGGIFYAVVYTMILKRRTVQNIVLGGAAGAIPPLIGWAAVTGELSGIAWLLFVIVFLWTPPHFWALALLVGDQYTRAGVPMMPGVRGAKVTANQILAYTFALLAASVAGGVLVAGLGWIYLASAALLGLRFMQRAYTLRQAVLSLEDPNRRGRVSEPAESLARKTFLYSMLYLALIFAAAVADRLILA